MFLFISERLLMNVWRITFLKKIRKYLLLKGLNKSTGSICSEYQSYGLNCHHHYCVSQHQKFSTSGCQLSIFLILLFLSLCIILRHILKFLTKKWTNKIIKYLFYNHGLILLVVSSNKSKINLHWHSIKSSLIMGTFFKMDGPLFYKLSKKSKISNLFKPSYKLILIKSAKISCKLSI